MAELAAGSAITDGHTLLELTILAACTRAISACSGDAAAFDESRRAPDLHGDEEDRARLEAMPETMREAELYERGEARRRSLEGAGGAAAAVEEAGTQAQQVPTQLRCTPSAAGRREHAAGASTQRRP